jgi:type I restriction enzyme R subunit
VHRNLRKALPNAAIIGFTGTPILSDDKTETRDIFGDYVDRYVLQDAELDGATVPILYEGRTADGLVKDAPGLDQLFEDLFRDYTPDELAVIKAKHGTEGDVLEAPLLIEQKARDMIRHYAEVVLPEGYKAQVVATSRQAAVTYRDRLEQARQALVAAIEALPGAALALTDRVLGHLPGQGTTHHGLLHFLRVRHDLSPPAPLPRRTTGGDNYPGTGGSQHPAPPAPSNRPRFSQRERLHRPRHARSRGPFHAPARPALTHGCVSRAKNCPTSGSLH